VQIARHTLATTSELSQPRDFPTFPNPSNPEWERRLGRHAAEFYSLSAESDRQLYYEGLLQFARRLEAEDGLEVAGEIYSFLSASAEPLRHRAQMHLAAMTGTGSVGARSEFLLRRLARESMEPTTLIGLAAASAVFRMTRLATLSRLTSSTEINFFTRGFGAQATASLFAFGAEATAFPLATRMGALALGRPLDWSPSQVGREFASSFLVLGALRFCGWGASSGYQGTARFLGSAVERPLLQGLYREAGSLGGILLGHRLEEILRLRPHRDGATTLVDSLALLAQFHVAGRLGQGLTGEGFATWERSLDFYAESLRAPDLAIGRRPGPPWLGGGELAVAAGPRAARERPSVAELLEESNHVFMSRGKGNDSDGTKAASLQSLVRQVSLFRDVRSVRLALRALYIGVTGPLREEILSTLERVEAGQSHGLLLRDLLADPRLQETRFLSADLQRRLTEQIRDLRGGAGNRDSGVFFFNLTHGLLEDSSVPKEPRKPTQLTAEALLPLQEVRLQELERLLAEPDSALPFTSKEALAEGLQLARNFARILRRTMKTKDRDFLTQLRNRASLDEIVPRLEQRLVKFMNYTEGPKLEDCVLMADIDHFKRVNDTRGHLAGDEVLRSFAEILRAPETIRLRDVIARYGGEEFLIFLFKAGREGAETAGERIRKIVTEHPIEVDEEDGEGKGEPIPITVSIGIAEMRPLPPERVGGPPVIKGSFQDAVDRADMALYAAKSIGRNRVVLWGDPRFDWDLGLLNQAGLKEMAPSLERALLNPVEVSVAPEISPWVLRFNTDHLALLDYVHGPEAAQAALREVATTIRETATRSNGIAARLGEDDFAVYFKSADREEVLHLAKQFRHNLAEKRISVEGRSPIHVTFSIGVAPMRPLSFVEVPGMPMPPGPRLEGSLQNAIDRAGQALLAAKKGGRNQIVLSP